MKTKSLFSRSALKGIAAALIVAGGTAGATVAVAQPAGLTAEQQDAYFALFNALQSATNKAEIVAALNTAAQAKLNKAQITAAINAVLGIQRAGDANDRGNPALEAVATKLAENLSPATSVLTFYNSAGDNQATASVGSTANGGGNAVSGSRVQQSNSGGGVASTPTTTTTTSVYVG